MANVNELQHHATLHDLTEQQFTLVQQIEQELTLSEGEITPEIEALLDRMASAELSVQEKFDGYVYVMDELEGRADAVRGYAGVMDRRVAGIKKRARAMDAVRKRMSDRMKAHMEASGTALIETDRHRFAIVKNGGKLPLGLDDEIDLETVPVGMTAESLDKQAVRAHLDGGGELAFARLLPRGTRLKIS